MVQAGIHKGHAFRVYIVCFEIWVGTQRECALRVELF